MKLFPNQTQLKRSILGTSLVEVLLTLVIVLALIGSAVISFSGTQAATALREGAERFETLIQFARAEASLTGKKYRLVFTESTNNVSGQALKVATLEVESNPVSEPGVFSKVVSSAVENAKLDEMIGVETVKIPGIKKSPAALMDAEVDTSADGNLAGEDEMATVTFYPDGSSDSVEIILAPKDTEETSRVAVRVSGVTGTVSRQYIESSESESLVSDEELFGNDGLADNEGGETDFDSARTTTTFSTSTDRSIAASE